NEEAGAVWLKRVMETYRHTVWLNPLPAHQWEWTQSVQMIQDIMDRRMFPMTLEGLDEAMRELMRSG
ncbi:MAG: VWA domain-containing protein, partial [Pseudomonadota bacterium]